MNSTTSRQMTDTEIKRLKNELELQKKENQKLKDQIRELEKKSSSKRYRAADKVGRSFDILFPAGSIQRKALKVPLIPYLIIKRFTLKRHCHSLEKLIQGHKRVYVIRTISWNDKLKQRPHHLALRLANKDTFVIYFDCGKKDTARYSTVNNHFVVTSSLNLIQNIRKNPDLDYYFQFSSTIPISLDVLDSLKKNGYNLTYEYIDEIDEKIFGEHTDELLAVWNNIKTIQPIVILASAQKLFEEAQKAYTPERILLSKNAVVVEDFNYLKYKNSPIPRDLVPILKRKKPIVGYYGAISPWLDYKIINETIKKQKDVEFVFIGVDYLGALKQLDLGSSNVHYLGGKDYSELPYYSSHFSCAIIPFSKGEVAKGTSPVKLYEYMAMGIPTVCTEDLTECYGFDGVLISKNTPASFSESISKALLLSESKTTKHSLLEQANKNSWTQRAKDINNYLENYEKENKH